MAIKAIVLDIDGTLTNSKKVITPKTKEALLKAQEKGVILMLASGRPAKGLMRYAHELEMDKNNGLLVCFNGARVENATTGEVLFNQGMSVEEGKAVLEHLKKFPGARPMIDKKEYMYVNDVFDCFINYKNEKFNVMQYEARNNGYILCEKEDLAAFADYEINKILTYGDPEYLQAHYEEMSAPFVGKLNMMFTSDFYYEYTAQGIDKAKALDSVIHHYGIEKEELMAFGDAQNDKTMVMYSGVGVAMANATDELKGVADYITLSNEEDGIAYALEQFKVI
ncbi:MAG: Cof-type HAD-IIB family hydrolase [Bacillota bacterium]|nr:Cof-type HAD-IIB family hydrolase [Bacillota bacterium]